MVEPCLDLSRPGECLTVFTARQDTSAEAGLLVRWSWHESGGFDPMARALVRGFELEEAFATCVDIATDAFGVSPRGLRMHGDDLRRLAEAGYLISGDSLGLAFLLGLLGLVHGRPWPKGCIAWGGLRPIRNDSFAVFTVAEVEAKRDFALDCGAALLVHPRGEALGSIGHVREIEVSSAIAAALSELHQLSAAAA
jgi:hypothetical protein